MVGGYGARTEDHMACVQAATSCLQQRWILHVYTGRGVADGRLRRSVEKEICNRALVQRKSSHAGWA